MNTSKQPFPHTLKKHTIPSPFYQHTLSTDTSAGAGSGGGTSATLGGDNNSKGSDDRASVGVPRVLSTSGKSGVSGVSSVSSIDIECDAKGDAGTGSRQGGVSNSSLLSSQRVRINNNLFTHYRSSGNSNNNSESSLHSISPLASPNGSFIQASVLSELEFEGEEAATISLQPEDDLEQDWRGFVRVDSGLRQRQGPGTGPGQRLGPGPGQGQERDGTLSPSSEFGDEWQESPSPETAGAAGPDGDGSGNNECGNSVSTTSENSDDGCLDAFLFSDDDSGSDSDAAGSDVSSISSQGLSYSSSSSQDTHKKVMINTAFNRGFALKRDPQDPLYSKSPIFPHQQLFSSFPIEQAPSRLILSLTDPSELKDQADDGDLPASIDIYMTPFLPLTYISPASTNIPLISLIYP